MWRRRLVALLVYLVLAEVVLRGMLLFWARFSEPPHCGMQPEILHRLLKAYSAWRPDPRTMVADPHRGYRHAPNVVDGQDSGAAFSTNSRGARGRREYALPKPPSTVRIVALGDSFTFGQGLPDDATWPAQLEARLPGTEVVNLGTRGYGHDQMFFALQDDGIPLAPDAVVLAFYDPDRLRDQLTYYCAEKPRFTLTAEGWQVENFPVPAPEVTQRRDLLLPLVYAVPRALIEVARDPRMILNPHRGDPARTEEILRRMRRLAADAGARFLMVNIPERPEDAPDESGFFHQYCASAGIECVDPWPDFRTAAGTTDPAVLRERYYLPHDMHYSRAGYGVVAEAVRRHLLAHPIAAQPASPRGKLCTSQVATQPGSACPE